ncbi:unnamed protein product [Rhizophagus irregularis]|nr:unnamed protein product [Rhizophagus irregularis]
MYKKFLNGFERLSQSNARTKKKHERFERHCRRIFKAPIGSGNSNLDTRIFQAQKHRFLFLESQYIAKPIRHLKYLKLSNISSHLEEDIPLKHLFGRLRMPPAILLLEHKIIRQQCILLESSMDPPPLLLLILKF